MSGLTEEAEAVVLWRKLPWLRSGEGRTLLYVGANVLRPPFHAAALRAAGWTLHLLEIFLPNVAHHAGRGLFPTLTWGDVRHAPLPRVDVAFWWHGCEHIPQADLAGTLARLEGAAQAVVLGCPDGYSPQKPVYGNAAEAHQWSVQAGDLEELGYAVVPYAVGQRHHLLAWKPNEGSQ